MGIRGALTGYYTRSVNAYLGVGLVEALKCFRNRNVAETERDNIKGMVLKTKYCDKFLRNLCLKR